MNINNHAVKDGQRWKEIALETITSLNFEPISMIMKP